MIKQIGQYKILGELGTGGMGVVYRALDTGLGREVALKRLRSEFAASSKVLERFRNEAKSQSRLNHPNIAQLYSLVQVGDAFCIVMEYVRGVTVQQMVPLEWHPATAIMVQVLAALECAHQNGVLHRDIKPENILVDVSGTAKVMDFGIAYTIGSDRMTREKGLIGTIEYMPPERILGKELTARSDIYSLGVVLYEALAGRLPFQPMSEYDTLRWHVEHDAPPVTDVAQVPAEFNAIIARAMHKNPDERYADCAAMSRDLQALMPSGDGRAMLAPLVLRKVEEVTVFDRSACYRRVEEAVERGNLSAAENTLRTEANRHPAESELQHYQALISRAVFEAERNPSPERAGVLKQLLRIVASEKAGHNEVASRELEALRAAHRGSALDALLGEVRQ